MSRWQRTGDFSIHTINGADLNRSVRYQNTSDMPVITSVKLCGYTDNTLKIQIEISANARSKRIFLNTMSQHRLPVDALNRLAIDSPDSMCGSYTSPLMNIANDRAFFNKLMEFITELAPSFENFQSEILQMISEMINSPAVPSQRAHHAARESHHASLDEIDGMPSIIESFLIPRLVSSDVMRHLIGVTDPLALRHPVTANSASTTTQNRYANLLKKYNVELPEDKEHFCCALMNEIMMDPVIDPYTLNSEATAWLAASDAEKLTMSRGNYDEAPRYDRKTLQQLIGADGTGKSPNTRLLFTAAQLIPDPKLKAEVDLYMQPLLERERTERSAAHLSSENVMATQSEFRRDREHVQVQQIHVTRRTRLQHVIGDLFFQIEEREQRFIDGETHNFRLIVNGNELPGSFIMLDADRVELINRVSGDINGLKMFFTNRGVTADRILRHIIEFERRATQSSASSASPAGIFDASRTGHNSSSHSTATETPTSRLRGPSIAPLD